ncbi:zinc ribbon domain-containing protein [Pelagibacterium halotolerans]|uniref:Uncharacterized protein n=1 Tax=Pelagibacterium halotolerans (strain DSM 22347 / JCM 15775 / CGMCC 1.7692 / B2) TaxID=1082931 RepID=G4RBS1_PELHB|nr:zinc ribbon domain-containing protein [Pelagibacterium halotolerans]AEQ50584.1 hypothetical protein KKY_543 [Pelagibacterium halotolerans B2]QJR19470.1 zinc ribbon domain-containing protein [Pelagibacterium halotolerans]SDZ90377.1 hypothetical protein SAMN05428936_101473 [Pelagibacterium halotolerans]
MIRLVGLIALCGVVVAGFFYNRGVIGSLLSYDMLVRTWFLLTTAPGSGNAMLNGVQYLQYVSLIAGTAVFVFAVFSVVMRAIQLALKTIWKIVLDRRGDAPQRTPGDYEAVSDVASAMTEGTMNLPKQTSPFLQAAFGGATTFVPPFTRRTVHLAGERLSELSGKIIRFAVFGLVFVGGAYWLHLDRTLSGLDPVIATALSFSGSTSAAWQVAIPILLLLITVIVTAILDFILVTLLVPSNGPAYSSTRKAEDFVVGLDHHNIVNQLPLRFEPLAWPGYDNRHAHLSAESASESLSDTGRFQASVVIERQPEPVERPARRAALLRLVSGWAFIVAGAVVGLFLVLQTASAQLMTGAAISPESVAVTPLAAVLFLALSRRLWGWGQIFIAESEQLSAIQRYKSVVLLAKLSGTQGKGNVRVGGNRDDSVESSAQTPVLNMLTEAWAAEVISEAAGATTAREMVSSVPSKESREWADALLAVMHEFAQRKARTVGVDTSSDNAADILRTNLGLSAIRERNRHLATGEGVLELPRGSNPELLSAGSSDGMDGFTADGSILPGYKLCPECAEPVREKARRCRYCQHSFDEGNDAA